MQASCKDTILASFYQFCKIIFFTMALLNLALLRGQWISGTTFSFVDDDTLTNYYHLLTRNTVGSQCELQSDISVIYNKQTKNMTTVFSVVGMNGNCFSSLRSIPIQEHFYSPCCKMRPVFEFLFVYLTL